MTPRTPASYALIVLLFLCVLVASTRVVLYLVGDHFDASLTVLFQATVTTAVGVLVYVVHRNGTLR